MRCPKKKRYKKEDLNSFMKVNLNCHQHKTFNNIDITCWRVAFNKKLYTTQQVSQ